MYVSNNKAGAFNILKTPVKFEPRNLPLIGKVIMMTTMAAASTRARKEPILFSRTQFLDTS